MMIDKEKIISGRKAVEAYREAHTALHKKPYYRQVHADHTPLLKALVTALAGDATIYYAVVKEHLE